MATHETTVHDTITDFTEGQWNSLVEQSDLGSLFHRFEWLQICEDALKVEPLHVVVLKNGSPVAIFPNFVRTIDAPDWLGPVSRLPIKQLVSGLEGRGGPITSSNEDECLTRMFRALADVRDPTVLSHAVRGSNDLQVRYDEQFDRHGYDSEITACVPTVDLTPELEAIRADMASSKRRELRRGHERDPDVTVEPLDQRNLVETYDAYRRNVERAGGSALPFSFFLGLKRELGDRTRVATMRVNGNVVGRHILLLDYEQSVLFQQFPAIGDESHFQYYPSTLLFQAEVKWGQEQGFELLDMGPTKPDFTDSVYKFKRELGATPRPLLYWWKGYTKPAWNAIRFGRWVSEQTSLTERLR